MNLTGVQIYANFIWFVTASYGNILYPRGYTKYNSMLGDYITLSNGLKNSGWIKSMFIDLTSHLPPNFIRVLVIKNTKQYVDSSFNLPPCVNNFIKCKTPQSIHILNGLADRNIIQCLNAGDKQGALNLISSSHKSNQEGIVYALVKKYSREINNLNLRLKMILDYHYEFHTDRERNITNCQEKIKHLQNKVDQIEFRIKDNVICPICLQDFDNQSISQCCNNSYCFTCINQWLTRNQTCPCCKEKLTFNDLYIIDSKLENIIIDEKHDFCSEFQNTNLQFPRELVDGTSDEYDKHKNLELLLQNRTDQNRKFLIFSCHDGTFSDIIPSLRKLGLKWSFLKGNSIQINSYVRNYKSGDLDVLLINAKNYGSGLNLENTTDLIMFHKFDNELSNQIVGRSYRPGRTQPLNIHYLLLENEL